MAKNESQLETPTAGAQVEVDEDEAESGVTETLKITPTMLDILEVFREAGESGVHQDLVKKQMQARFRRDNPGGKTFPPPIDTELSSLLGGLIEAVPDPAVTSKKNPEWLPNVYRITESGAEALEKMRPPKVKA